MDNQTETMRVDKWLWQARFFKSRSLAAKLITDGKLRINGERRQKTSTAVAPDDTLTFPQGRAVRVIKVVALGTRRGPASEAQELYEDMSPPAESEPSPTQEPRSEGHKPSKRERRQMDRLRRG